jgi:hypothetical protein
MKELIKIIFRFTTAQRWKAAGAESVSHYRKEQGVSQ